MDGGMKGRRRKEQGDATGCKGGGGVAKGWRDEERRGGRRQIKGLGGCKD